MRTKLLHYFSTYRWELWLLIGIPAVVAVVRTVSVPLSGILLSDRVDSLSIVNPIQVVINAAYLVTGIVSLLLLSLSYLRVRRLERELLASLWGYSIAVAIIVVVTKIAVIVVAFAYPEESLTVSSLRATGASLFASLLEYLALLWFARQLSRVSLTHAFFLVAFTSLNLVIPISGTLVDVTGAERARAIYLSLLVGGIVSLIVALIKVWLLGNFDRRGERFRKEAIIILVVVIILSQYARVTIGELLGYLEGPYLAIVPWLGVIVGLVFFVVGFVINLVTLLVLFGSAYLVRVRQPKTLDATPVPASNC